MKRKMLIILLAIVIGVGSGIGSIKALAANNVSLMFNNQLVKSDALPELIGGKTLVPLRVIAEALGVNTNWIAATNTVVLTKGATKIILPIGSNSATVNGKKVNLDSPAIVKNRRTLVPVRFIGENLGVQINWDGSTRTVNVVGNFNYIPITNESNESGHGSESNEGGHGSEGNESSGSGEGSESGHGSESGEDSGESGDPASPILSLNENWDGEVNGIRTAMSYDANTQAFSGIVENVTNKTIRSILIELNLKLGTKTVVELGPYPVGDLAPGEKSFVKLLASEEPEAQGVKFNAWQIHPEAEGKEANESGHGAEGSEGSESSDEAGSMNLGINDKYDVIKNGARLILAYDKQTNSFNGTVENKTTKTLTRVRVEIHLSNGAELGPTTPTNLAPGQKISIKLPATATPFDKWSTHAEMGSSDNGGESGGEGSESGHGSEGSEGSESGEGSEGGSEHGSGGN